MYTLTRKWICIVLLCMQIPDKMVASNCGDSLTVSSYPILYRDSPVGLLTMRQSDVNYLSIYRLLSRELFENVKPFTGMLLQDIAAIVLVPLTHEEGHRSILTSLGIGSISQPFFNKQGIAYVNGVTDFQLKNIRDNDLPNYIRLHTAGLESDYMLALREENEIQFKTETKPNLFTELLFRKVAIVTYYMGSLFSSLEPKLKEEVNELKNDVVGHDVYGAIKNLHRPSIDFYRYTRYADLTSEERHFVERAGFRSLLNLASSTFIKALTLVEKQNLKISTGAGYSMCPFGDFLDENIWIRYKQTYKVHAYLRQFENRKNWFLGGGLNLIDYPLTGKLKTDLSFHCWSQPRNLDFNTKKGKVGGATEWMLKYPCFRLGATRILSLDVGFNYKTEGFLPEEVVLKEHFGLRFGTTLYLN